tara:strand:- start:5749 stop:6150 length:402 start_codon:yes stop_codon:yes gene_type:complete
MTFLDALQHAWLTDAELVNFFQVSLSTIQRWKRNNKAPTGVIQSLKLIAGDCPSFSAKEGWNGWAFSRGYLWSPELDKFTPGDIRASKLDYDIIRGYEKQVADLQALLLANKKVSIKSNVIPFPLVNKIPERA